MSSGLMRLGGFAVILIFLLNILLAALPAFGQSDKNDRSNIDGKYKWNLEEIYPSVEAWHADKEKIRGKLAEVTKFKGQLGVSGSKLKEAFETFYQIRKEYSRAATYAARLADQDTRESGPQAMRQEMQQLGTEFSKVSAYINPEILSIPKEKMDNFFKEEPGLETYRHIIDDIQRSREHILNEDQEAIIAEAGRMSDTAQGTFSILSNADLPYPTVTLSDGREVRLDAAGYAGSRASANRDDRIKVVNTFFGALSGYSRTFGTQLMGEINKNIFYKSVRKYESSLESALDGNNIPTSVYHKLIENMNKNLAIFHRYLRLRKRMLGVDELHYYDMYPSMVKAVDLKYTYEEAGEIVKKSLEVLGAEYVATVDKAITDRWIDVYPNTGKRSGAYMSDGAYDVHPYMLLNYNGQYDDMSTMTHELGHAMHSYFSAKHQPYHNSGYPIFLAEVASTANEAILIDHMLKTIDNKEEKLALLGNYLDGFKGTLVRQTQFAEFELKIHDLAEEGEALTGDKFSKIYLEILKKYYGHDEGVMVIDDQFAIEWAYIPHFYYNFYVFQYSTSFMAAQALAEVMLSGDSDMVDKYINFLSSGGSEYAIPTLKKVGIDMTTDEPFTLAMKKMNKVMDDMEEILEELGR
jgi:oligoendopeptidase F